MDSNWFQEMFINEAKTALNKDGDLYTSGQVGHTELKRISYNSYTDTKEIIPYGNQHYARVLDTPITLSSENFKSVTMGVFWPNNINMVLEYTQEKGNASIRAVDEIGGAICIFGTDPDGKPVEYPIVAIFEQDLPAESAGVDISKGVYFFTADDAVGNEAFIIKIDLEYETIHPIDPKFIPAETPDVEIFESYQTFTKQYVAEGEAPDNVQWKEYYDPVMVFIDTEIPADGTHVSLSGLDVAKLEQLQTAPVPICFTMDNGYSHAVMPVFTVVLADGFMSYSCQYALTSRVIFQRNPNGTWEAYKQ